VAAKATIWPRGIARRSAIPGCYLTRELGPVLLVLLAFVAFKVAFAVGYVAQYHGLRGPLLRWRAFSDQLRYAARSAPRARCTVCDFKGPMGGGDAFLRGHVRFILDSPR